jgi:hypothetical protein
MRHHGTTLAYVTYTEIIATTAGQLGYILDFWKVKTVDHNLLDSVVSVLTGQIRVVGSLVCVGSETHSLYKVIV